MHTSLDDRSLTIAGLHLWKSLPLHLRNSELTLRAHPVAEDTSVCLGPRRHRDCYATNVCSRLRHLVRERRRRRQAAAAARQSFRVDCTIEV